MNVGRARVSKGRCDNCSRDSISLTVHEGRRLCGWCGRHSPMAKARARLRAECAGREERSKGERRR